MDPTTWAWIAMVVGAVVAIEAMIGARLTVPAPLAVAGLAALGICAVVAVAGSLLVAGWGPWGAGAAIGGGLVASLAEVAAAGARESSAPSDRVAARLAVGMAGLGLFTVAGVHLLMSQVLVPDDARVVLAALAIGPAVTAAVSRIALIGVGVPRLPASEVVALVVAVLVALGLVAEVNEAFVGLGLGVVAIGVIAAAGAAAMTRRGERSAVFSRRTLATAIAVAVGGGALAGSLGSDLGDGAAAWWFGAAVSVGAVAVVAVAQVMEWFTSDRWRSAKRVANRARSGAAAVITTGIGDAARATAWLLATLGAALVAAERLGRQAGDGLIGMALMVTGAVATLGAVAAGLGFVALTPRAGERPEGVSVARHEAAEARAASAAAAGAISRGLAVALASLSGLALLLALGRSANVAAGAPGVWAMLGSVGGVAAAWYAVGWASHLGEPVAGHHRVASSVPTVGAILRRALIVLGMGVMPIGLGWVDTGGMWVLLAGVLAAATGVGLTMVVAAGAWDNVRRLIETGAHGGPASRAHRAAVAADTLGERWREAVTPALMGLVVFAASLALALAPLID